MHTLRSDIVYALRNLRHHPAFAVISILTLALGIGANAAIFSVVNGVVLKPLAYPDPGRLVFITSQFPGLGFDQFWVSPPEFVEFRDRNQSFQSVGAYRAGAVNLGTREQPRRVNSAAVSSELMPTLGVQPLRGRLFTREDTLPGAAPVAILSSEVWRSAFAGDEGILRRSIKIDDVDTRVVGVMPDGYDVHGEKVAVWQPLTLDPANPGRRGNHYLYLVGRLKTSITLPQARAELETLLARWPALNPGTHTPNPTRHRLRYDRLRDDMVGGIRTALWVLQGAVAFVLLIACANLANLLLARAESRQKEFAVRSALGAGHWRLLRQFLTEGVLLALIGGALGVALGFAGLKALLAASPASIPRAADITLDPVVLLFTCLLSIVTGLVFGMAPLLYLREHTVTAALKEGGQRSTAGAARNRIRGGLVIAEIALAVVLVVGAGLLLRSFWNLLRVDAGFNREHLVTFGLVLPSTTYRDPQEAVGFFTRLIAQVGSAPGVQHVAAMAGLPPKRDVDANDTNFDGYAPTREQPAENVDYYQIASLEYLQTMGIPVAEGRGFEESDRTGAPVVLVNETLAKTFYRDRKLDPIGQRLKPGFGPKVPWFRIVGVVRDVKQGGVASRTGTELYFLLDQLPKTLQYAPTDLHIVARTSRPVDSLAGDIRRIVGGMDPTLPIVKLQTMDDVFADSVSRPRFLAELLGIFAGLALLLAALGTYGILSYTVTERRREIGIQMALGASRGRVMTGVLARGLRLTLAGLAGGVAAALVLTRLLSAQLFHVRPTDPATLAAVVAAIAAIALAACYVPAARAMRVDPMVVLRDE
ncbi:MAG TPA: ABC transporter permease [Vicinamibacterales bacterium]|nr:ABC transporter permease [Vicinamibacterales bacterium]